METYKDQRSDLAEKKYKLFETRNVEKWQCKDIQFDEPVNEVLSSQKLAYKYILPNETQKLREMKRVCEFASYQQIAEYLLFRRRSNRRFVHNFTKFGTRVKTIVLENPDVVWNAFDEFSQTAIGSKIMEKDSLEKSCGDFMKKDGPQSNFGVQPQSVESFIVSDNVESPHNL